MKKTIRIAAFEAAALAPAAYAQSYDQAPAQMTQRFKASDKNGDGNLIPCRKPRMGGMTRVVARYATIDDDKGGYVTFDQLKAELDTRYR